MNNICIFSFIIVQTLLTLINSNIFNISQLNTNSSHEENKFNNYFNKKMMKNSFLFGNEDEVLRPFRKLDENEDNLDEYYDIYKKELEYILSKSEVRKECKNTLEQLLLGKNYSNPIIGKKISNFNIKKLLDDSSKHKNDLGTYDQCIFKTYKLNRTYMEEVKFESVYVVFILDESNTTYKNTDKLLYHKNSTNVEDIYYVRAFCLPQIDDNCSNMDYYQFMSEINKDLGDMLGIKENNNTSNDINPFFIRKNATYDTKRIFTFLKSIPIIIFLINFIIIVFREPIINIFKKYYESKNTVNNNELKEELTSKTPINNGDNTEAKEAVDDEEDEDEDEDEGNNKNKKESKKSNTTLPKWLLIYNKCFNFSENFKELFNFSLNSTNINNDSGLSYIRGLKSSSLLLLIFGLTYLTLMNSLSKIVWKTFFFSFLENYIFYGLFFIGLRYSPRVIFSCSGYTLAYKYLCYINKNFTFLSIFKFIFYQIHKYLFLFFFLVFERYALYQFYNYLTFSDSPMWKYLYINILSRPDDAKFYLSFFSQSTIFVTEKSMSTYDQTLIDYFWLPYNEIFFFVIGLIIISIGYKFKLRIDIFLIILILLLYGSKIVFTYIQKSREGGDYYATLYYYLYDYGKFMINPLFNLPSYLIGMYFGLINYSVQKGITSLNILDLSQDFKNQEFDLKNITSDDKKNEADDEEDDDDIDNNNHQGVTNNNKDDNGNDEKNNYRTEIKEMPFLIPGVNISNYLRKHRVRLLSFIIIVFMILIYSIHFIVLKITIGNEYNKIIDGQLYEDSPNDEPFNRIRQLLTLEDYITNTFINIIFRIDIEIIVFLSQALLFIFYFKGQNFVNDFYCHIFWAMLNKSYFSYILFANPTILFIFYQTESKIILNLYNLLLYSLISGSFIFLLATISYIFIELPYKRLIHYICSSKNRLELEIENKEKEKDDNSDDEDD